MKANIILTLFFFLLVKMLVKSHKEAAGSTKTAVGLQRPDVRIKFHVSFLNYKTGD